MTQTSVIGDWFEKMLKERESQKLIFMESTGFLIGEKIEFKDKGYLRQGIIKEYVYSNAEIAGILIETVQEKSTQMMLLRSNFNLRKVKLINLN